MSTGHFFTPVCGLVPSFRIPIRKNCGDHKCGHQSLDQYVVIGFRSSNKITPYPHPQGVRLWSNGFSHGLKTCHWHVFLTAFRIPSPNKKSGIRKSEFQIFGRSIGIRTRGLLDPNQARYQTSPYPDSYDIIMKLSPNVKALPHYFGNIRISVRIFPYHFPR